eukprot:jgi/Psemu1/25014/gm1.25014_g
MTPTTNSGRKRGANPHSNHERTNEKKGRLKDPPPNTLEKNDYNQNKHPWLEPQFGGYNMFHCIDDKDHDYYVSGREEGEGKEEKSDTAFSELGPIPHQIDVMVNFFLYELDNGVTGVLGLLTRKQISKQFKDYNMSNKWFNFKSLLQNVHNKSGVGSLCGRNVVNYTTMKKYMIVYREILVWYMKNVQYPPGSEYVGRFLFPYQRPKLFSTCLKKYVNSMKNFLDCLMAQSSLCVSLSHSSYNQRWVPVGFHRQGDTNILKMGKVLLPPDSPLVFHYVLNYKDTISNYYNIHFQIAYNRVTLSPSKLGTGKIDLAHFTITKGIIYLGERGPFFGNGK